ncbi:hypothetical protein PQX77_010245 [Marasmius sp. AFHP31]|nr:hypothetical protein PQX77_010245 [Marasmius sp. AFHP31]
MCGHMNVQLNGKNPQATFVVGEPSAVSNTSSGQGLGQGITFTNTTATPSSANAAPPSDSRMVHPEEDLQEALVAFEMLLRKSQLWNEV